MSGRRYALVLSLAACSSKGDAPRQEEPPSPPPVDAAPADTISEIGDTDPSRALDPDPVKRVGQPTRAPKRPSRPIDIVLKSSPTGATAYVDGVEIGHTPTYWYGESDGRNHEFTFTLRGHGAARYKFVPLQSGTVHAKLELVDDDKTVKPFVPPAGPPAGTVKPPDTVLTPTTGSSANNPPAGSGTTGSGAGSGTPGSGTTGSGTTGSGTTGSGTTGSGTASPPTGSGGSKIGPQP